MQLEGRGDAQGGPTPPTDYAYDPNGNRLARTVGPDLDDTYTLTPTSNRLEIIETLQRDTAPPPPAHTNREYHYNQAGRLSEVIENGLLQARYTYNAEGQRTRKVLFSGGTLPTGTTLYHYDLGGQLLAETTEDGTPLRDYLWHDDEPLAQIDTAQGFETLRYLHTDHIKTPRLASSTGGAILWRWEGEAFGSTAPELASATINLRFPGQYFDAETGLHYNYFRDYDPTTGRYSQSDPIGLAGGINTYAYTYNNPTGYFDSNGGNPVAAAARGGYLAGQALNAAINYTLVATTGLTLGGLIYETVNPTDNVIPYPGVDPSDITPIPGPPPPNKFRCYSRYLADLARCIGKGICPSGDQTRTEECIRRAGFNLRTCLSNFPRSYPDVYPPDA